MTSGDPRQNDFGAPRRGVLPTLDNLRFVFLHSPVPGRQSVATLPQCHPPHVTSPFTDTDVDVYPNPPTPPQLSASMNLDEDMQTHRLRRLRHTVLGTIGDSSVDESGYLDHVVIFNAHYPGDRAQLQRALSGTSYSPLPDTKYAQRWTYGLVAFVPVFCFNFLNFTYVTYLFVDIILQEASSKAEILHRLETWVTSTQFMIGLVLHVLLTHALSPTVYAGTVRGYVSLCTFLSTEWRVQKRRLRSCIWSICRRRHHSTHLGGDGTAVSMTTTSPVGMYSTDPNSKGEARLSSSKMTVVVATTPVTDTLNRQNIRAFLDGEVSEGVSPQVQLWYEALARVKMHEDTNVLVSANHTHDLREFPVVYADGGGVRSRGGPVQTLAVDYRDRTKLFIDATDFTVDDDNGEWRQRWVSASSSGLLCYTRMPHSNGNRRYREEPSEVDPRDLTRRLTLLQSVSIDCTRVLGFGWWYGIHRTTLTTTAHADMQRRQRRDKTISKNNNFFSSSSPQSFGRSRYSRCTDFVTRDILGYGNFVGYSIHSKVTRSGDMYLLVLLQFPPSLRGLDSGTVPYLRLYQHALSRCLRDVDVAFSTAFRRRQSGVDKVRDVGHTSGVGGRIDDKDSQYCGFRKTKHPPLLLMPNYFLPCTLSDPYHRLSRWYNLKQHIVTAAGGHLREYNPPPTSVSAREPKHNPTVDTSYCFWSRGLNATLLSATPYYDDCKDNDEVQVQYAVSLSISVHG